MKKKLIKIGMILILSLLSIGCCDKHRNLYKNNIQHYNRCSATIEKKDNNVANIKPMPVVKAEPKVEIENENITDEKLKLVVKIKPKVQIGNKDIKPIPVVEAEPKVAIENKDRKKSFNCVAWYKGKCIIW